MLKFLVKMMGVLGCSFLLISCADTQWVKPGATPEEQQRQYTACEAQALKELHPDNIVESQVKRKTEKSKKHHHKKESDQSADYRIVDANASERDILVNDCMYHAGWQKQIIN
ncbi:hypothetical protein [Citrobacter amalonaticus]|uniref:hypothetical protein n=1 Tax=Citrobacter amalonaticus TaxID=35703 RepID=UPI00339C0C7C